MFFLQVFIYFKGVHLKPGEFADTDCYMRMLRAEKLVQTHNWYDQTFERSNAPLGETSHWGRLMDLFIIALAVPFSLIFSQKNAFLYAGILISPILLVFCGFAMAWASRPFLKQLELPHILLLFFSQASVILFFQAGRPDHHSLLLLLFVLSLGFLYRLLGESPTPSTAVGCALVQATAFSVSLESITTIVLSLGILTLAWIWGHLRSRSVLIYSGSLLGFCFLFFLLEKGWSNLGIIELDRMTSPHLTALAIALLFWIIVAFVEKFAHFYFQPSCSVRRTGLARRGGFALLYSVAGCSVLFVLFPEILWGPYGQMDPRLEALWLQNVMEVQPLWQTNPGGLTSLSIWLSPALAVFAACLYFLYRKHLPSAYRTWPWLLVLLSSALFSSLTFYQIRWASYAQTALVLAFCAVLSEVLARAEKKFSATVFRWLRLGILFFFCSGYVPIAFITLGSKLNAAKKSQISTNASMQGDGALSPLTQWMESKPEFAAQERILAHLDLGPELLYRTKHEVIATPYHRNSSGMLFFYDLMNKDSEQAVLSGLRERGITLILLQPESSEKSFLNQSGRKNTFYQKLVKGAVPPYLKQLTLPAELSSDFKLFRVLP